MLPGSHSQLTTQDYLDVYDITNDLVILKSGVVSLILSVGAMNFGLLAEAEQDAVIYTYAALLNSLNYPLQILIQSQTKDITDYLNLLKQQEVSANSLNKRERIQRYRHFVSEIIRERNVLDKKFYAVVPASPFEVGLVAVDSVIPGKSEFDVSRFEKSYIIEKAAVILEPRRDHLVSQFGRIGLYSRQLETQEIIRIFYTSYNPEASEGQELADTSQYTTPVVRASLINSNQSSSAPVVQPQLTETINTSETNASQGFDAESNRQTVVDQIQNSELTPQQFSINTTNPRPTAQESTSTILNETSKQVIQSPTTLVQVSTTEKAPPEKRVNHLIDGGLSKQSSLPQSSTMPGFQVAFQENLDEFKIPDNLSRRVVSPTMSLNSKNTVNPSLQANTPITTIPTLEPSSLDSKSITSLPLTANNTQEPPNQTADPKNNPRSSSDSSATTNPEVETGNPLVAPSIAIPTPTVSKLDKSLQSSINQVLLQVESPDHSSVASPPMSKPSLSAINAPKGDVVSKPVINLNTPIPNTADALPPIAEIE